VFFCEPLSMPGSLAAVIDARSVRTNRTMYVNVLTMH